MEVKKADEVLGIDGRWREHVDALQYATPEERLNYLFETFPRLKHCTHASLAYVIGMTIETVTRAMKRIKKDETGRN
jgi:hypothetical protein